MEVIARAGYPDQEVQRFESSMGNGVFIVDPEWWRMGDQDVQIATITKPDEK